jgi:hypothetical protein
MKRLFRLRAWRAAVFLLLALLALSMAPSCGGSDYMIFSLREGIGHFSMEYPPGYSVTRIDLRNEVSAKYTDIGLSAPSAPGVPGLNEISVYAWPAGPGEESAAVILNSTLDQASGIFTDFNLLEKYSVMLGDIEGQAAKFTWTANATNVAPLSAVSNMVCFRHNDIAWEVHVASGAASQDNGEAIFNHILETLHILN